MAGTNNTSQWEVPKFSFSVADQADKWKIFYVRDLDYIETLDIDMEAPNQKKRWKQIRMMFTHEERQILQTLIDNDTTTSQIQETPKLILIAIQTTI